MQTQMSPDAFSDYGSDVRRKSAPRFTNVMVDLFGSYQIKWEVQKRITGKGYEVIYTDSLSRAVHIESGFSYDSVSLLSSFYQLFSVYGWPKKIFFYPGSQLV